jgi:ABC-2 type transport system permease protein
MKHGFLQRMSAVMRKEIIHIRRDPRTLGIMLALPVVMLMLFGYAVRLDVKNISLTIRDQDNTPESRELIRNFEQSGYYSVVMRSQERIDPHDTFVTGRAVAVLTIPRGFAESLFSGSPKPVQVLTDASDANSALIAGQYAEQIVVRFHTRRIVDSAVPVDIRDLVLFNPELESTYFIVPGLVAVLFIMVCALMTAITISREKETGTMEQILVSPVRIHEIILGKVLPYVVISAFLGIFTVWFAMEWFRVPFRGNPVLLGILSIIYILCSLSLGILISTKARTMQVALMIALVSTMLPSVMLSGFMFPIASMPRFIRAVTYIVPARHYLTIIRGIMLKNAGWTELRAPVLALCIFACVVLFISIKRFKSSLE